MSLLGSLGCVTLNRIPPPCAERKRGCEALASGCRKHVYIFMVDGLDPCDVANLEGLRDYLCELGFPRVWLGHFYHVCQMEQEILDRFHCDPDAKFVLIGHGTGAEKMRALTNKVKQPGVTIDLLVYLNPVGVPKNEAGYPSNARQVLNVGGRWSNPGIPGAENLLVPEVYHFAVPTYWCVRDRLLEEVATLASEVPLVETVDATPIFPPEPRPRPVTLERGESHDEWDFLLPGSLHWTKRDNWDFLKPDLVQEVIAPMD